MKRLLDSIKFWLALVVFVFGLGAACHMAWGLFRLGWNALS